MIQWVVYVIGLPDLDVMNENVSQPLYTVKAYKLFFLLGGIEIQNHINDVVENVIASPTNITN